LELTTLNSRSARNYYAQDAWDVDSWLDVIAVEYVSLVEAYPFDQKLQSISQKGSINLLDVGCGTAIFPSYLDQFLSENVHFSCDLLDVSQSSLEQAARVLDRLEHFSVDQQFHSLIEDIPSTLPGRTGAYDVIWAIHSFTTVDIQRMDDVYLHLLDSLAPGGYLFIYQLAARSSYQKLHKRFRTKHPKGRGTARYMEYEDTKRILDSIGAEFEVHELFFHHEISDERPDLLERYLRKCILDDSVDVQTFFQAELQEFHDEEQRQYRIPQSVNFVVVRR
jgi:SAM-dependent methyltransferase